MSVFVLSKVLVGNEISCSRECEFLTEAASLCKQFLPFCFVAEDFIALKE